MSFTAFLRPPLVWLVTAEAVLVAILGGVAWHAWQQHSPAGPAAAGAIPHAAAPAPAPAGPAPPGAAPAPQPSAPPPQAGPTPGIRTDQEFLSRQLTELNRVEATFADLEWRVTRAVVDAIQRYLDGVVLPSIERSEGGRR
jgi:hypothetical protein